MKVTIVLRSPFLDKIPNLKNLAIFLASKGASVKIFSAYDPAYPQSHFESDRIIVTNTSCRTKKLQLPTSLGIESNLIKDILFDKSDVYISGDFGGARIIELARKIFNIRYWNFLLEYPEIGVVKEQVLLQKAERIITHDKWHSTFLDKHFGTKDSQFLYLPNSTFTGEYHEESTYLSDVLGIDKELKILLHSGGLGRWFMCEQLAVASKMLPEDFKVVFHTSHNATGTEYYHSIRENVEQNNLPIVFSLNPVSDKDLDKLVASATIGLAFYSLKELGYRAENMGLAAGKIGNYLKCGVPVIATNVPSLSYINDYHCGVLIDSFDDLPAAVNLIMNNYKEYRSNAYMCYRELWEPTSYLEKIYQVINKLTKY